jgi:hypothetical protein
MSLESKIELLIKAVEANTAAIAASSTFVSGTCVKTNAESVVAVTQAAVDTPVVTAPLVQSVAPVSTVVSATTSAPVQPINVPAAVTMPATPTFTQPAAAAPTGLPFNDAASVMAYTVSKYGTLGKDKGAKIQDVLTALGCTTLTDLKPEQYPHYYAGVEAL